MQERYFKFELEIEQWKIKKTPFNIKNTNHIKYKMKLNMKKFLKTNIRC